MGSLGRRSSDLVVFHQYSMGGTFKIFELARVNRPKQNDDNDAEQHQRERDQKVEDLHEMLKGYLAS